MSRLQNQDAKYYLGSVSHSLEHLPKWYQICAVCGIFVVIYLRDNPIISWLVVNLHSSFGTECIWYDEYQVLLEQMSFNERLCFTLYGVSLAVAVLSLYKLFCRETYSVGWSASQLFPDRKGYTLVVFIVLCLVESVRMRDSIAQTLGAEGSLANFAIKGFVGLEESSHDVRLASSNQHFIVQTELIKAFLKNVLTDRLPIVAVSAAFRLSRDIPRRTHAALRWHMVTVAVVAAAKEVLAMYLAQAYDRPAAWATVTWACVLLGTVNFVYGPSKRGGMVVTVTTANSLLQALRAVVTCTALWCIASLLVLTVIVSVHVVELISLWLILSLLIVWTPAVVDSCSTDYVTLLSGAAAWIGNAMGYLTLRGSVRFGLMLAVWWLTACLVYSTTTNLARNRYGGLVVILWFFFWAVSPPKHGLGAAHGGARGSAASSFSPAVGDPAIPGNSVSEHDESGVSVAETVREEAAELVSDRLRWLCRVADYDATLTPSRQPAPRRFSRAVTIPLADEDRERAASGREFFSRAIHSALLLSIALLVFNHFLSRSLTGELRSRLRRNSIVLVTPAVLCRKAIRTAVLVFCVVSFLLSGWTFREYVLPYIARFMPDFVSQGISTCIACVVLGALMDMKESMYDGFARLLGMLDPPELNEDGTPMYEGSGTRHALDSEDDGNGVGDNDEDGKGGGGGS